MARKGRIISSTGIYHILMRGNDRLFFSQDDYSQFLELLKKYFSNDASVYAYSLDKNKIHLAISLQGNPSDKLKPLSTAYARYVNRVYGKAGKLFYDRFVSEPIESNEALSNAVRYITKIPSQLNSESEYSNEANVCDVKSLGKMINLDELYSLGAVIPCTDDFSYMSDSDLKRLILKLSGLRNTSGNLSVLKEYIIKASTSSNLSKARLFRIFNIAGVYSDSSRKSKTQKNPIKPKIENTNKAEKTEIKKENTNNKKELSVWLL